MHKVNFGSFSFDWLIDPEAPRHLVTPEDLPLGQWVPYPIPEHIGNGGYEAWPLTTGMSLFRGVTYYKESQNGETVQLAEVSVNFPEPTFQVQSIIQGSCIHNELNFGRNVSYKPSNDLFRYSTSIRAIPIHDCSSDVEMIALMIGHSVLHSLLGEQEAEGLLKNLDLMPPPKLVIKRIPLFVSEPLHHALDGALQPSLKGVLAQAKALEYLVNLSEYLSKTSAKSKRISDRKNAANLRDYLLRTHGQIPTLTELSVMFGQSARILNEDFESEFGTTIYAFLQEHRMNSAHEAIVKTSIPLKQLSERLGYTHVNNFSAAFKRRYGYSPGALRKNRVEEGSIQMNDDCR